MTKTIQEHEGSKYLRLIQSAQDATTIRIDIYAVLEAFGVTCPGRQQAIKKLLCAGLRDKGSELDDLIGAEAALSRAIELQKAREIKKSEAYQRTQADTATFRVTGSVTGSFFRPEIMDAIPNVLSKENS